MTQKYFVQSLVDIALMILEKNVNMLKVYHTAVTDDNRQTTDKLYQKSSHKPLAQQTKTKYISFIAHKPKSEIKKRKKYTIV